MRRLLTLALWLTAGALTLAALARPALAQPALAQPDANAPPRAITVALDHSALEGCEAARLDDDLRRRLGRDAFVDATAAEFLVRVTASHDGEAHELGVLVEQRGRLLGERRVEAATCEELLDRAALIVALVVDTQLPGLPPAPAAPSARSAPEVEESEIEAPEVEEAPRAEPTRIELQLSLVGAGHVGWFPGVSGGGGLGAVLRIGELWSLHASALGWVPSERVVQEPITVRMFGGALRLGGCLGADADALHLAGCLTAELGVLRVEGQGLDEPASQVRASLRAGAELRATLALGGLRLGLGVGLDTPLLRDRYVFDDADRSTRVAHAPDPVAGIVSLSLGFAVR